MSEGAFDDRSIVGAVLAAGVLWHLNSFWREAVFQLLDEPFALEESTGQKQRSCARGDERENHSLDNQKDLLEPGMHKLLGQARMPLAPLAIMGIPPTERNDAAVLPIEASLIALEVHGYAVVELSGGHSKVVEDAREAARELIRMRVAILSQILQAFRGDRLAAARFAFLVQNTENGFNAPVSGSAKPLPAAVQCQAAGVQHYSFIVLLKKLSASRRRY